MSTLALIFPGIGYTFDRPLLYYSQKLALSRGMEVRRVPLSVTLNKTLPNDVRMDLACRQAAEQGWAAAQDLSGWDRVVLIAKSIGTVAAAAALQNLPVGTPAILYTPLEQTFHYPVREAVVFTGTDDPWVRPGEIPALCKANNIPFHLFEGANHSLETGDVLRDIEILRTVMEETAKLFP